MGQNLQNLQKAKDHHQVCVWPGTEMPENEIQDMEEWFKSCFDVRVKFLECIITNPNSNGPGGRSDLLFTIHKDDVLKFAAPRLEHGIRWLEDVVSSANGGYSLYPVRVHDYKCWDADA